MTRHPAADSTEPGRRSGLLALLALGWVLTSSLQAATPDDALSAREPGPAVVQSKRRLDTAEALLSQAERAQRDTEQLQAQLMRIDARWKEGEDATQSARAAVQAVDTLALPGLRAARQAWAGTAADVTRLTASHQAALAAVAQAAIMRRGSAMSEADAQARARAWAEQTHEAARERHRQAIDDGRRAVTRAADRRRELQQINGQLNTQLSEAAGRWAAVDETWRSLRAAVKADAAPRQPMVPSAGLTSNEAPWAVPDTNLAAATARVDAQALAGWRSAVMSMDQAQDASWLRIDAAAFVSQTLANRGICADTGCPNWKAEQQTLVSEAAMLASTWAEADTRLMAAQAEADALPAELADHLARHSAQRESMTTAVAQARDVGQPALRALIAEGQDTRRTLADRRLQAERGFVSAWRAQYGRDPVPPPRALGSAPPAPAPSYTSPSAGMMPPLRQHALHRMFKRNDEPAGFGAYTYVVVGTGAGRDSAGVQQRLASLLAALQDLTPAEQVEAAQRPGTNVFVVPVQAGSSAHHALAYELRLAQAFMGYAPPAVRMPSALQRALVTSNGPFLITLPGRMADAQASWPVLFADLNSIPAVVVADVVRSYMGDLLVGFEPSNAGWKPPALQRVALTLVRMVQGTGDVVMAAFPPSIAAPAPR